MHRAVSPEAESWRALAVVEGNNPIRFGHGQLSFLPALLPDTRPINLCGDDDESLKEDDVPPGGDRLSQVGSLIRIGNVLPEFFPVDPD